MGFLNTYSEVKCELGDESSSDCLSEQDSCQDTQSFGSPGEDADNELENEIKLRHEADDELASIFWSSETRASSS
eukprot:CAMPEP_0168329030 /NCGR_PEP_ID=MMETSP0213-20121227/6862_1 /TAXON_ID=151035 /ORGANISM="Euplotes harpa, Strain FSP1.4" /LENGTH=74 /DNA_ID=CAMNT_0008332271 /DNA_START=243 /DNA_END=467 /DNA_ORIENTATION=-